MQYVGKHHLRFAGNNEYCLKAGADAPETLLAYADFDNTRALKKNVPLKTWTPHVRDWHAGDPAWKGDKGKGLIGADICPMAARHKSTFRKPPENSVSSG